MGQEKKDPGNSLDEIKDYVYEYYQQGKIAIFVGAGVSAMSGYPSWSELIIKMAEKIEYPITLKDDRGNKALSSDEYLKIPQIFYENKGSKEYIKTVRKQLHIRKQPNDIHKLLMRLKPDHFLTTNYDTLIEQTANITGATYSVINSDEKVAEAPTRHYIIKVHGDFETNNFVLKESDYLNYENNFKLIDNLMKSIISTHLVIFVGYSLGDYNIKLILNWVKRVQKTSFIDPVFIYTGYKKLSDVEIKYYRSENLKVIDSNGIIDDSSNVDYIERYKCAIEFLLDNDREKKWNRNSTWVVDYFYKKFVLLKNVNYMRTADIASLFSDSKFYDEELNCDDFKYLNKAFKERNKLSKKRNKQLDDIITRIINSGVESVYQFEEPELAEKIRRGIMIDVKTFNASYQEISERVEKYNDNIDEQYCKAYDLFLLGKFDEAMEVYYHLVTECYAKKNWVLYFFSEINLYYIRQTIIQLDKYLKSVNGMFLLGKNVEVWDDSEMYDVKLSHMLTDVPAEIKKFSFLNKLTAKNYYQDDFVRLSQDNYEIEKEIAKSMITLVGRSKDQRAKIKIYDAVNFIYSNKITFSKFSEHKRYVKIALRERFKGMINQTKLSQNNNWEKANRNNNIDFQELLLVIRNFSYDDLVVFYEKEQGDELCLRDIDADDFENYISNLIDYFSNYFSNVMSEKIIIEYLSLKDELKNALFLASYYVDSDEVIIKCIEYFFEKYPYNELDIEKRILILERFKDNLSKPEEVIHFFEDYIANIIKKYSGGHMKEPSAKKYEIDIIVRNINKWFPLFKSPVIKYCLEQSDEIVKKELEPIVKRIL